MAAAGAGTPPGQIAYTTPGTYTWVVPAGVTSVSVVCVGGGADGNPAGVAIRSGGGGALSYVNNITVSPGESLTVIAGATNTNSAFKRGATFLVHAGGGSGATAGSVLVGTGGSGGAGRSAESSGGGGAGGYSGAGGIGGNAGSSGGNGSGGGGGGSGGSGPLAGISNWFGSGGGGVGLLGQGSNGSGGAGSSAGGGTPGGGGSGGGSGGGAGSGVTGGTYGGGAGCGRNVSGSLQGGSGGGSGAVRIIWPGTTRQFPSTNTGDV